ncbi:hypothetical protein, partial [Pseudomonas sp. FEN]
EMSFAPRGPVTDRRRALGVGSCGGAGGSTGRLHRRQRRWLQSPGLQLLEPADERPGSDPGTAEKPGSAEPRYHQKSPQQTGSGNPSRHQHPYGQYLWHVSETTTASSGPV